MKRKDRPRHTAAEQVHLDAVQRLGCLVCGAPALIHHVRSLAGVRITRNHRLVLPLCWAHHSADSPVGFHAGSKPWQVRHGSEADLLALVSVRLGPRYPAWAPCEDCGEFVCAIHGCHTGECYCPGTEVWDLLGIDPYSAGGNLAPAVLQALVMVKNA